MLEPKTYDRGKYEQEKGLGVIAQRYINVIDQVRVKDYFISYVRIND